MKQLSSNKAVELENVSVCQVMNGEIHGIDKNKGFDF